MPDRLERPFFRRDSVTVARALLGQRLVRRMNGQRLAGTIVETEAYLGVEDKAAHSVGARRTARNESMWQDGGTAYVYFTYGMHYCFNVVTGRPGNPIAVLIRALEPTEGQDAMFARRAKASRPTDLCSGPAKLCQALAIDRDLDGEDLVDSQQLFVERLQPRALPDSAISAAARIGVHYAEEWAARPLRFFISDNPHVSRK